MRPAGPVLGAGLVTCGLLVASLLSEARAGDGAVPAVAGPDPAALSLAAATVDPTTAPPSVAPQPAAATTAAAAPTSTATAPPATAAATSITGAETKPVVPVEAAPGASWTGILPDGALSVAAPAVVPVGVRIDAVGVAAPVIAVGTAEDQQLELPADAVTVAWFEGGPVPGGSGSALLAAHVDFHGQKGVFFDLATLDTGTRVEVDMSDGSTRAFATTGPAVQYPKYALPISDVFRRGGEPQITLVTCGGKFDRSKHSYEDNTVVVATPVA